MNIDSVKGTSPNVDLTGPTKCWSWSGSKLFDTLMVFVIWFFETVDLVKIQQTIKYLENLPSMQRVNPLTHRDAFCKQSRPRSGSSCKSCLIWVYSVCYWNMKYLILHNWTWQIISLFYVPKWKFTYIIIHSGWSLAWIFMKEGLIWKQ